MTDETLADLMRRAGLRPAWQGTREARPGYQQQQSPAGALADPRTVPYRRVPTRRDREFSRAALADTMQRGAYSEPRNQFAEAGMNALETTGAPEIARGVRSIQANEPGQAAGHFALGGLGLLGTASLPFGGGARSAPPRVPRIQPEAPYLQQLRTEGFDVPAYRGLTLPYDEARAIREANPNAPWHRAWTQWFSDSGEQASRYAMRESNGVPNLNWEIDEPNVFPAMLRMGRNVTIDARGATSDRLALSSITDREVRNHARAIIDDWGAEGLDSEILAEAARRAGYDTITMRRIRDPFTNVDTNRGARREQTVYGVLSREPGSHIRPRFGSNPSPEPEALPNAPPRLPTRATDGTILPLRPPEPMRQSLVGGSDDLADAARMRPDGDQLTQMIARRDAGRTPLEDLARQDPLNATFPWDRRATPTEDMVRAAFEQGATRGPASDAVVATWGPKEHAERIATLMREGWDDPISLREVEGRLAVNDGYHRLAAARLRGDRDIATEMNRPPPMFPGGRNR